MPRTTDDPSPEKFQPFGPAIKPLPKDYDPGWKQVPDAEKGVEQDREGHLRTNIPANGGNYP